MTRLSFVFIGVVAAIAFASCSAFAADLTGGVMYAVPVPRGQAPVIDGNLSDWDMSGAEPIWISPATAGKLHGTVALMYDDKNLYLAANVSLPGRPISNPNNPVDAYWTGDVLEFRVAADPALPSPLDRSDAVKSSDRVAHLTMWKNSASKADYMAIAYGVDLNKGLTVNPAGSKIVIAEHDGGYTVEARIPWSALRAPGGMNPFAVGSRMTAVWGIIWVPEGRTAALYRQDPGDFAFQRSQSWGQVEFSASGHLAPRHPTMEVALASASTKPVGVPITFDLPSAGKISVNIFGPRGEVIRELIGGEAHAKGKLTVYWDGHDQFGSEVVPGKYRWGAYLSGGLSAEYKGTVGMSGTPPYQTLDGTGGWIGDHSEIIDTASDSTGVYILAPVAEAQRSIIKVGYDDKTVWRKTPWIGGGWGPLYSIAANGKYVFITYNDSNPQLVRLDSGSGQLLRFDAIAGSPTVSPISDSKAVDVPTGSSPIGRQPEASGIAASAKEVFVSVFSQNVIQVMDAETGLPTRQLQCSSPRGVTLDASGNLYAVSYAANGSSRIIKFALGQEPGTDVVKSGLIEPWHVAVDAAGRIYASQEGASQQVAVFDTSGKMCGIIGKVGGRTWGGDYRSDGLLRPAGLAVDSKNRLLIVEGAIPKLVSRYDTTTLKLIDQWYGAAGYWNADIPDPDNPLTAYYPFEPAGFGRATVDPVVGRGRPTASWDVAQTAMPTLGEPYEHIASPEVKYLVNGREYLYSDTNHGIFLIDRDQMVPIGSARFVPANDKDNETHKDCIELWSDLNGNHAIDDGEVTRITSVAGLPLPGMANCTGSMWVADNGDLYLISQANSILRIPAVSVEKNGLIRWNASSASWVASAVIPSCGSSVSTGWRQGLLGVRTDSKGNLYTCYNYRIPVLTDKLASDLAVRFPAMTPVNRQAYATDELATSMNKGLGHTGESNAVKFVKLDKSGNILWVAGRKATAAAEAGEMYHFWVLAGMVGENYIAGGSEWGQMYFYTSDGFFVDALFNNPGLAALPGPYTFGGETSGGRVRYFSKQGQVYAYCNGGIYLVHGFDKSGKVIGETRLSGDVQLDHDYNQEFVKSGMPQLTIVPLAAPNAWEGVPSSMLMRSGEPLAQAQVAYDSQNIYAHIHVLDPTPMQNGADDVSLAFKGGDAVGIDLGRAGDRNEPQRGDIRILAARIGGVDHLIAMKPVSDINKQQVYYTPAGGRKQFDFVGDLPGGKAVLTPDKDGRGYVADLTIPRGSIDFAIVPGTPVKADIEVLLSGQGGRGLQAVSRNYLFTPLKSETTMTDDIPTESWLYPQYWGEAVVK